MFRLSESEWRLAVPGPLPVFQQGWPAVWNYGSLYQLCASPFRGEEWKAIGPLCKLAIHRHRSSLSVSCLGLFGHHCRDSLYDYYWSARSDWFTEKAKSLHNRPHWIWRVSHFNWIGSKRPILDPTFPKRQISLNPYRFLYSSEVWFEPGSLSLWRSKRCLLQSGPSFVAID